MLEKKPDDTNDDVLEESVEKDDIHRQINEMSLEEKAGQVLMIAVRHDAQGHPVHEASKELDDTLTQLMPGGIILFSETSGMKNRLKRL